MWRTLAWQKLFPLKCEAFSRWMTNAAEAVAYLHVVCVCVCGYRLIFMDVVNDVAVIPSNVCAVCNIDRIAYAEQIACVAFETCEYLIYFGCHRSLFVSVPLLLNTWIIVGVHSYYIIYIGLLPYHTIWKDITEIHTHAHSPITPSFTFIGECVCFFLFLLYFFLFVVATLRM